MKTLIRLGWIIPALAFFAACSGDEGVQTNLAGNQAVMTGLTIETYARTNIVIPNMPQPIDAFNWDDDAALLAASVEGVPLQRDADAVLARFRPVVSFGAHAVWGIGSRDARPFGFTDIRVPATFENGDVVYFKVTSEDGFTTNYYRFSARVKNTVVELAEVYIGRYETHTEISEQGTPSTVVDVDERMKATIPDGLASNDVDEAFTKSPGSISIMTSQSRQAEIKVVPFDSSATVKFALVARDQRPDEFQTSNVFDLVDTNWLYIEITAENGIDKAYYKFRVDVGRIATIKSLTFTGTGDRKFPVVSKGTQSGIWTDVVPGSFKTADMPAAGFGVEIELDDPASTASYQLIANKNAANPSSTTTDHLANNNPSNTKVIFNGTNVLALKVISENTRIARYYKIDVELLAANFVKQPKSDYYYYYNASTLVGPGQDDINWYTYARLTVDPAHANFTAKGVSQVVPLSVELDRTGSFTYQWYEANSWYGGYGFDADGRILYYPPGNPVAVAETGFTGGDANNASTYYVNGFDEKKNVSFHNGGNQFYRLPTKGRIIPGETSSTYLPSIDKRPFIDGFTSETHYYWVEVTDSQGRKAVSNRAAIVSERDPTKKHHIVNMNEDLYLGPKANPTETGTARNPNVFTFQRQTYKIPVTFPAGFNVNDYTVATVQALFFLKDGTPWIQNWTQGDIGFETADGSQLIYYNLTNNNGTLGLVGGGKEPNGGSLTATPVYLIVKPAGEKPVNELPPFQADGVTPQPNNNAQGWFCGFIELVEVRFEGPAR